MFTPMTLIFLYRTKAQEIPAPAALILLTIIADIIFVPLCLGIIFRCGD